MGSTREGSIRRPNHLLPKTPRNRNTERKEKKKEIYYIVKIGKGEGNGVRDPTDNRKTNCSNPFRRKTETKNGNKKHTAAQGEQKHSSPVKGSDRFNGVSCSSPSMRSVRLGLFESSLSLFTYCGNFWLVRRRRRKFAILSPKTSPSTMRSGSRLTMINERGSPHFLWAVG